MISGKTPADEWDIDYQKLQKLEKMIVRVDADIQRMQRENDKLLIVETLKKTHDIYQLILGELHFQLTELKLEKFGNLIQKIFLGENTLLNSLLKMKTNLEFSPNKMIENLEELRNKARRRNSSTEVVKAKEDPQYLKIAEQNITEQKLIQKRKQGHFQLGNQDENYIPKTYTDKFTDTSIDKEEARKLSNVLKKNEELADIKKEVDDSAREMENFLKERKNINFDNERSKAESSLKSMLKDLTLKKRKAEQMEREGENLLLSDPTREAERKAKQAANAALIFGTSANHIMRDGKLIQISTQSIQTDEDPNAGQLEKALADSKLKTSKLAELEKKIKEVQKDSDIYKEQTKKLNDRISDLMYTQKQKDEEDKKDKEKKEKENKVVMSEKDKERFKNLVEDNYRMKLKMKELLDQVKLLEKESKQALEKFKSFINNSGLSEDQKKMLLGKAEELFDLDIGNRLNLRELEVMSKIDNEMLKDPLIRSIVGDPVAMVKKIKQQEKDKVKMRSNPNYNPDFDETLLEDGQRLITRKIKKKVRRQNSKGEWIEEEVEIEEDVIVDQNGNIMRTREKPKVGPVFDPNMQSFVNKHGGLAIGGAKFVIPQKPQKPVAKNGQVIKEGEWFVDQTGNKVKMTKNNRGEEEYEVQEEFVDESGNKQMRNKKVRILKDKDGNEILMSEYVDPKTGKRVQVQKKVLKGSDGIDVVEEITVDELGRKVVKRTKVLKDKDGNDYIEEEIVDEKGNKLIVKKKKLLDINGNEVWTTETTNADGTKVVITEKIGQNGEKIQVEERIDKMGKKTIVERKLVIGSDGQASIQEVHVDEKGNRITKNIKQIVDRDGNAVEVEEQLDENGNKVIKRTKHVLDKDGNRIKVEETVDSNGNKITKFIKQIVDKDGNTIHVEESVDDYGNKITKKIKKIIDKDGNEVIEEEVVDAKGNRVIIRTKKNRDGSVEEERIDPSTGERVIVKKKIDSNGREVIEETRVDRNGKAVTVTKVKTVDASGQSIIEESYVDPQTGKKMTVRKRVVKDDNGNDIVEESYVDENGGVKTVKKRVARDKDGRDVIEEDIIDADGKKVKVRTKIYKDADGNEIMEEERVDDQGNKVVVRRLKDKTGKEIIEEVRQDKNGNKTTIQKVVGANGMVEETVTDSKGNVTKIKKKVGTDDKEVQTNMDTSNGSQDIGLESMLINLGCTKQDANMIAQAIMNFLTKGTPFVIGDEDQYAKLRGISGKHEDAMAALKEQRKKEMEDLRRQREDERLKKVQEVQLAREREAQRKREKEEENEDDLEVIDEKMTEQEQSDALFKRLKAKGGLMGELLRNIRNQLGLSDDEEITLEHFRDYLNKYKQVHSKCGDHCPHLKRFYSKLGFIQNKYKRKFLKMKDTKINAFKDKNGSKLPKIGSAANLETLDGQKSYSSSFYNKNNSQGTILQQPYYTEGNISVVKDKGSMRLVTDDLQNEKILTEEINKQSREYDPENEGSFEGNI